MQKIKRVLLACLGLFASLLWGADTASKHQVYIIPVSGAVSDPQCYILRRGIKQALREGVDCLLIEINTPGGALDVTLEMMEALEKFPGDTIAFVNEAAISAGSYIAIACRQIYMSPNGLIGAAAVIKETGGDLSSTLKLKIDSYLMARCRQLSEHSRYRDSVQRAMMDSDFVLTVDGKVLKNKGELLTLTAKEATQSYGQPLHPLLADGIAKTSQEILDAKYGPGKYEIKSFEVTWSEKLAKVLVLLAPVLMGIGMLCLFIEFKTPGFGIFGILGIVFIALVFVSHYVAGLAEWTGLLIFLVGVALVLLELVLFPGVWLGFFIGFLFIVASLIWGTQDIWPNEQIPWNLAAWRRPLEDFFGAIAIVVLGAYVLHRFLPRWALWDRLVLHAEVPTPYRPMEGGAVSADVPPVGSEGRAMTGLYPQGEVEVNGLRYEAHVRQGALSPGARIVVVGYRDKVLLVDSVSDS